MSKSKRKTADSSVERHAYMASPMNRVTEISTQAPDGRVVRARFETSNQRIYVMDEHRNEVDIGGILVAEAFVEALGQLVIANKA